LTRRLSLIIIAFCFLSDQMIKWVCRTWLEPGESIAVLGDAFRLTLLENHAGVMGIDLLPMWVLSLLSILAILAGGAWLFTMLPSKEPLAKIIPWVLGGAFGNLYDRIFNGSVTDMFDVNIPDIAISAFSIGSFDFSGFELTRWWVFNLADSFIFVSMILIIVLDMTGRLVHTKTS
jgi:signal peptidase II